MFVYTIGDIVGVILIAILLIITFLSALKRYLRQALCKHNKYRETMSCDAICVECGKNLGFIGTAQKVRAAKAALGESDEG